MNRYINFDQLDLRTCLPEHPSDAEVTLLNQIQQYLSEQVVAKNLRPYQTGFWLHHSICSHCRFVDVTAPPFCSQCGSQNTDFRASKNNTLTI